jgi:hypothetical protein
VGTAVLIAALLLTSAAPPAELRRGDAWHVGTARLDAAAGCPRCVQTESWAATIPYADPPNQLPPWQTLARLPRHGIVVHLTRSWEPSPPRWIHRRRTLRIVRADIHANFEGNAAGRASVWSTSTWRAGSYVSLWVFFGSPRPSAPDVARAQREIDATRFRPWRIHP